MRGDKWSGSYSRKNPCPDSCELCGRVKTVGKTFAECDKLGEDSPLVLIWDHCHDHGIVRGALCRGCNVEEGSDRSTGWRGNRFTEWRTRCPECVAGAPSRDPNALAIWLRRETWHTGRAQRERAAWEARDKLGSAEHDERTTALLAEWPYDEAWSARWEAEGAREAKRRAAAWAEARAKKVYEERLETESWADRWLWACRGHHTDWHTLKVRRKLAARWEAERPTWEKAWASGQAGRDAQWEIGRRDREALWTQQWEADAPAREAESAQRWENERPEIEAHEQKALEIRRKLTEQEEQRKQRARARRVELRTIRAKLAARAAREEQKKLRDERRAVRVPQGRDRNGAAR